MNVRNLFLFFLPVYLACSGALAGSVIVHGEFAGAQGEEIRLMRYADLVSRRAIELDVARVDTQGKFSFRIDMEEPGLLFFRVMHSKNRFYAIPGNEYHAQFEPFDRNRHDRQPVVHPLRDPFFMTVHSKNNEQDDVNRQIELLNGMVAHYLETQVAGNRRANHRYSMMVFGARVDSVFQYVQCPFLSDYVEYTLAYLHRVLNTKSFNSLYFEFLYNRTIQYHHPAYMDFLHSMFEHYLFSSRTPVSRRDLHVAVNIRESYPALMDTLGKDTLLRHERLRELVMLIGLQQMVRSDDYNPDRVLSVIRQAASTSKFPEHAAIAFNLYAERSRFRKDSPAPGFALHDTQGQEVRLEDYRGQYVYLFFGAGWCPVSMAETGPMLDMAITLQDHLKVIGVMVDDAPDNVDRIPADSDAGPRYLHFGGNYRLLDDYRIRSVPQYVLIDPEGKILRYPFLAPSAGAAEEIRSIME